MGDDDRLLPFLQQRDTGIMTIQKEPGYVTVCGGRSFVWGERTYVMGVVNVTPDSFSGDGLGNDVDAAVDQALRMEAEGADIIDVGGESTRRYDNQPKALPVNAEDELKRVIPVIEALYRVLKVPVSVDTYKATVARKGLEAGASMVNNVWGVLDDPEMPEMPEILDVASTHGVPVVLMHNQSGHEYGDLVSDVTGSLRRAVERALASGIPKENIIVDPGIGFGKVADQSLELERRLAELKVIGQPVLVGPSRKSHVGLVLGGVSPEERLHGTAAAVALCIAGGADIVRVHDVREMVQVARMSDAITRGWRPPGWGH